MEGRTNIKQTVETLSTKLQETVQSIQQCKIFRPTREEELYVMVSDLQTFLLNTTGDLYEVANQVGNVVEDHIRSVYLFTNDATLEGHVTELETQLGQLRILSDGVKSLPSEYNDEVRDVIARYLELCENKCLIEPASRVALQEPKVHGSNIRQLFFLDAVYMKSLDTLKNYRETAVKILSVLAMTIGRWENKIEDRVGEEDMSEGMVMTNVTLRRSKKKKSKDTSNSFYN
jgi:hypothetical protein